MMKAVLVLLSLGWMVGQPVWADAQFNVPVDLKQMGPSMPKVQVACSLYGANPAAPLATGWSALLMLSNGAYAGDVPVSVKYDGPSSQVKSWRCKLFGYPADAGQFEYTNPASLPAKYQPQPGTVWKTEDSGQY